MNQPVNRQDLALVAAHRVRELFGDSAGVRSIVRDLGIRRTARLIGISPNRVYRLTERLAEEELFERVRVGDLQRVLAAAGFRLAVEADV